VVDSSEDEGPPSKAVGLKSDTTKSVLVVEDNKVSQMCAQVRRFTECKHRRFVKRCAIIVQTLFLLYTFFKIKLKTCNPGLLDESHINGGIQRCLKGCVVICLLKMGLGTRHGAPITGHPSWAENGGLNEERANTPDPKALASNGMNGLWTQLDSSFKIAPLESKIIFCAPNPIII
jgi:hypothetical protein